MRVRVLAGAVLGASVILLAPAGAANAEVPASVIHADASDNRLGERLVNSFMSMLQRKDVAALREFLSPAFQIVRSNGTSASKQEYLASLPDVTSFTQTDFHVTRSANTLVVRNTAVVSVAVNGQQSASTPAPRLSVFERNRATGKWQMVAHGNFVPFS